MFSSINWTAVVIFLIILWIVGLYMVIKEYQNMQRAKMIEQRRKSQIIDWRLE